MIETLVAWDIAALEFLRSGVDPDSSLHRLTIFFFSDAMTILVALFLVGIWLYAVKIGDDTPKRAALLVFYSVAISGLVYLALNQWLPIRPRPETVTSVRPIIDHLPDNSFPSGHAIFSMACILGMWLFFPYRRRLWIGIALVLAIGMNLARILAGIHYPGDILVGFVLGATGPMIALFLSSRSDFERIFIVLPIQIARWLRL